MAVLDRCANDILHLRQVFFYDVGHNAAFLNLSQQIASLPSPGQILVHLSRFLNFRDISYPVLFCGLYRFAEQVHPIPNSVGIFYHGMATNHIPHHLFTPAHVLVDVPSVLEQFRFPAVRLVTIDNGLFQHLHVLRFHSAANLSLRASKRPRLFQRLARSKPVLKAQHAAGDTHGVERPRLKAHIKRFLDHGVVIFVGQAYVLCQHLLHIFLQLLFFDDTVEQSCRCTHDTTLRVGRQTVRLRAHQCLGQHTTVPGFDRIDDEPKCFSLVF